MKEDRVYLEHVLESIRRVEENAQRGKDAFLAEATQRLSDVIKTTRPEIDWRRLAAFRNILVHDYLGIDLELVWRIVERDVPVLKAAARAMTDQLSKGV